MNERHLTIRITTLQDGDALGRLAQLDGAPALTGLVLMAERDGAPVAASRSGAAR